jgi:N-acetylglucosaminyldiphosphoundecaprenol N-acetyl-beta-D-mannosaminyltransferase
LTSGRLDLLGVPLDPRARQASVEAIEALLARESGCAHVVTLNPEYVMAARRNPAFAAAIERADLVLADGAGVVLAARLLGGAGKQTERLTGVEIVELLAQQGVPSFFLGGAPGVAEAAAARLSARWPHANLVGIWADASPDPKDDAEAINRIAASRARAVAVAFGAEGQVAWIDRNRDRLDAAGVRLAVGVGGSFDYLSGMAKRPPKVVRDLGLEWLWRLAREPWRWRRQLVLPKFALLVLGARLRQGVRR